MHTTNTKIAFFGTPKIAQIVLEGLAKTQYKPQLVVTSQDARIGRGQKVTPSPVAETAQRNNLKIVGRLEDLNESFELAILVAYGFIIPKRILDIPKYGFINIHPSLLPKFRGPAPIQAAILAGEKETGVTIMQLDEEVDHGSILAQEKVTIAPSDTTQSLTEKLAIVGVNLLLSVLPNYLNNKQTLVPQNHKKATYTEKITKDSGRIDLAKPPSPKEINRMTHAYFPWPSVWTEIEGKRFKILPDTADLPNEFLIQPEGKKPLTLSEFSNGYNAQSEIITKILGAN